MVLDNTALDRAARMSIPPSSSSSNSSGISSSSSSLNGISGPSSQLGRANALAAAVMANASATLRFPGYMNNDLVGLVAGLVPTPLCHFLVAGYTPLSATGTSAFGGGGGGASSDAAAGTAAGTAAAAGTASSAATDARAPPPPPPVFSLSRKITVLDVMRRLLQPKNILVSMPPSAVASAPPVPRRAGGVGSLPSSSSYSSYSTAAVGDSARYISALHILRGEGLDPADVQRAMARLREGGGGGGIGGGGGGRFSSHSSAAPAARFVDWGPAGIQVALARAPPVRKSSGGSFNLPPPPITGLMLANHTGVRHLLSSTVSQLDKLLRRRAFLDGYKDAHPLFHSLGGARGTELVECLDEFEDAREVVLGVAAEYEAAEGADYIRG